MRSRGRRRLCAAEGRGAALSYGRADGVARAAYIVTCGD